MEQPRRQRSNEKFGSTTCFLIQKRFAVVLPVCVPVLLKAVAVKHFILESVNTPPKINYLIDSTVGGNLIVDLVVGVVNKLLVRLNIHYMLFSGARKNAQSYHRQLLVN
jgi:hypothetical protein